MPVRHLALVLLLALPLAAAELTVAWNAERQSIDGFGGSSAWYADEIAAFPQAEREEILRFLFDPERGIGCSILRMRIDPGHCPQDTKAWQWQDEKLQAQGSFVAQAMAAGAQTLLASPWSPPAWMKDSGTAKQKGRLLPAHYDDYAAYLASFVTGMREHFGVTVDVLSIQNESDEIKSWECCIWTPEEQIVFIGKHLAPLLEREGIEVALLAPECTMWNQHFKDWSKRLLDDPATAAALDVIAGHRYRRPGASPFPEVAAAGKRLWMSEYFHEGGGDLAIANARVVHDFLVDAEVNAYLYWWLFAKQGKGDKQMLLQFDEAAQSYTILPQAYAFGNFSRFIRPGYRRIATDGNQLPKDLLVSAYKAGDGTVLAIVVINATGQDQDLDLVLAGVAVAELLPHRSSARERLAALPAVPLRDGTRVTLSLPAASVTTYLASGLPPTTTGP